MEVFVIVVAFVLIFAGVYGLITITRDGPPQESPRLALGEWSLPQRPAAISAATQQPRPPSPQPGVGGLFTEVDMLRAQVEHLRTEITALSNEPLRSEKPHSRRYQTGPYTYLPRELRREVHKVRSVRHLIHNA